jgi:imidazolonepropionase-like amidohydrolase
MDRARLKTPKPNTRTFDFHLKSHVSRHMSHVPGLTSHVSRLLSYVLCLLILIASVMAKEEPVTAIKGGDLYTITSGIIRNGTILIKDGKIWRMGQNVEIPEKAEVIDAKGKVVMPGLIAANAEVGVGPFGGINKIADSLDPFHYNVSLALASGVTAAFVSRGGPSGENPMGGTNAAIKTTYGDLDNMLIKEPVAENVSISNSQWLRKTNFRQKLHEARTYLRKIDEYQKAKEKDPKAEEPKKPDNIDSYIRLLKRELPARLRATTTDDILAALEMVDEFGIRVILEDAVEAWTVAEEIGKRDVSLIITPRDKRRPNEDISAPSGSTLENAAILKKAGVKFAVVPPGQYFGTGGMAGRDLMTLPMEAAFAVRGGLDEQTALESITINAAEILDIADRVGSLQVGKDADIIILDGHLFHHKTFVELTLINGKVLYDKAKSTYFSHITD